MWINTPNARVAVSARRGLRLKSAHGTRLRAVQGRLWVTLDNDPRDIVLDPGESFVVDSNQPLIVMPLGDCATLDVKSPAPPSGRPPGSWLQALWPGRAGDAVAQTMRAPLAA